MLSLEALDELNRPFRVKEPTFMEVKVEEREKGDIKEEEMQKLKSEGASLTPASVDNTVLVNFIDQLENRNHATLKQYLITQHESIARMFKEMSTISSLKCLSDRSLSVKPKEDLTADRVDMEAYYTFASIIKKLHKDFYKKVLGKEKTDRAMYEKYAGIMYRLIFQKAYSATNKAFDSYFRSFWKKIFCCRCRKRKYVHDLWDRIEVKPLAPFSKFDLSHSIWRDYQINERNDRSYFRSMDRIKLLHNMLLDSINIYELEAVDLLAGLVPINDEFFLEGKSKEHYFEQHDDVKNFSDPPEIADKKGKILGLLSGMVDTATSSDFLDTSLADKLSMECFSPSEIDVEAIQNYFGEKIALYFEFLKFHTKRLYFIGIFGVIVFIVDYVMLTTIGFETTAGRIFDANNVSQKDIALLVFKMNRIVLAVATVIWSSIYLEHWKRKQQFFAIKYGMTEFENNENKRPSFSGEYIRNLASSAFNVMHYPSIRRLGTTVLTYVVVVVLILISIIIAGACLLVRRNFREDRAPNAFNVYFVPAFINYLAVKIIEYLYYKVAMFFNMKENHETLTRFEDALINKIFTFNFFNAFNSYFIIGFIKYIETSTGANLIFGNCINTRDEYKVHFSCYEELEGQAWSFFVLTFFFNFFEILGPMLYQKCRRKFVGIPRKYRWGKVDTYIEKEYQKEQYIAAPEVDGVLKDYSEVTIQFSSLSFFGVVFPLAYILSYFTSVFEIHIDKLYYMHYIRRPIPRSAADIGSWQYILEAVSFFTIFVNAGLIVFTSEAFNEMNMVVFKADRTRTVDQFSMKMKYYVFLVFVLLFIKLVLGVLIKDTPENLKQILARHKHIIGRTIKKPRESNANGKSGFPMHPLPQQIGLITDMKKTQATKATDDPKSHTHQHDNHLGVTAIPLKQEIGIKDGENPFTVD